MREAEAYRLLGWPHDGNENDGDAWLAFQCGTPGCQSEGVARSREFGFGRCGRCGAIMEIVNQAQVQPHAGEERTAEALAAQHPEDTNNRLVIQQEVANAEKLSRELEELVLNRKQCPDDDRNLLLLAYWSLVFDLHKAILTLITRQLYGAAFALVRPCLEALVRAHVAVKGSLEDIRSLQKDTYFTDFDKIGPWIDREFRTGDLFGTFIGKAQVALHSFTHVGLSQIGRRIDGHDLRPSYNDGEIIEVIKSCTSAAWMVNNLVTIQLGFNKEANKGQELYLKWGEQ